MQQHKRDMDDGSEWWLKDDPEIWLENSWLITAVGGKIKKKIGAVK